MKPGSTPQPRCGRAGFSLMEVLVALGLGSLVLAAVASLTLFGTRSSMAIVNYTDLDAKSRYALDLVGREVRRATAVVAIQTNTTSTQFIQLTNALDATTTKVSYDPSARTVTLSRSGQPDQIVLTECDRWNFGLFQRTPWVTGTNILFYPATNSSGVLDLTVCKLVNLAWKCSRQMEQQKVNTESVQAAQLVLRNKQ